MIRTIFNTLFGWVFPQGKNITDEDFPQIFGIVGAYLHQDMDIDYETVPEALAAYARVIDQAEKQALFAEMTHFLERYHDDPEGEFDRRYGFDFTPSIIGQTVPQFFDMLRAIIADPDSYRRFE